MYGLKYFKIKTSTINLVHMLTFFTCWKVQILCFLTRHFQLQPNLNEFTCTVSLQKRKAVCKIQSYMSSPLIWDQGNCNCKLRSTDILTDDGSESNNWKRETKLLGFLQLVALLSTAKEMTVALYAELGSNQFYLLNYIYLTDFLKQIWKNNYLRVLGLFSSIEIVLLGSQSWLYLLFFE